MTPEESLDQLVDQVGPNIVVPDPSLIRKEAIRQARARTRNQGVFVALCAALFAVGVLATIVNDQTTPVATASDELEDGALPTTSVPSIDSDLETEFQNWIVANKVDAQVTSIRASAINSDQSVNGVRANLVAFPLDDGFEYFVNFAAECGPDLFHGMIEFENNTAVFRQGKLPDSSNIGFDFVDGNCKPPQPTRLQDILGGEFEVSLASDGIAFYNDTDGVTFQLTDFNWQPLAEGVVEEAPPTSGVPNQSMSDVMLLASPSEVFYAERFEGVATEYAERCDWLLAGSTEAEFDEGIDVTESQISRLLAAIGCEGGLVVRTSGEVMASELSSEALARLGTVTPDIPFIVQVDGPPTSSTPTTTAAATTSASNGGVAEGVIQLSSDCRNEGTVEAFGLVWLMTELAPLQWRDSESVTGEVHFDNLSRSTFTSGDETVVVSNTRVVGDECVLWPDTSADFTVGSSECLVEQEQSIMQDTIVFMGDGEGLGFDPAAIQFVVPAGSTLVVRGDDSSTTGDLDGDGDLDTLQFIDISAPNGDHLLEGIRICGTSRPLNSFFVPSSNGNFGALVVPFPGSAAGIVNRGPITGLSQEDVWLFDSDGDLLPPYARGS